MKSLLLMSVLLSACVSAAASSPFYGYRYFDSSLNTVNGGGHLCAPEVQKYLDQASELDEDDEDSGGATELYEKALKVAYAKHAAYDVVQCLRLLGRSQLASDSQADADKSFAEAINVAHKNGFSADEIAVLNYRIGASYYGEKNRRVAEKYLQAGTKLSRTTDGTSPYEVLLTYAKRHGVYDSKGALDLYKKALAIKEGEHGSVTALAQAKVELARGYEQAHDYDEEIATYKSIVTDFEHDATVSQADLLDAKMSVADTLWKCHRTDTANKVYNQVLNDTSKIPIGVDVNAEIPVTDALLGNTSTSSLQWGGKDNPLARKELSFTKPQIDLCTLASRRIEPLLVKTSNVPGNANSTLHKLVEKLFSLHLYDRAEAILRPVIKSELADTKAQKYGWYGTVRRQRRLAECLERQDKMVEAVTVLDECIAYQKRMNPTLVPSKDESTRQLWMMSPFYRAEQLHIPKAGLVWGLSAGLITIGAGMVWLLVLIIRKIKES